MKTPQQTAVATDAPAIFDISAFDTQDVSEMTVMDPVSGKPTTWKISFAGPGHEVTIAQSNEIARKSLADAKMKEQARVNGKKWKGEDKTPEEARQENADYFTARMLAWTPVKINGADYPFSRENAAKLLLDPRKGGLYNQILEFLRDDDAFMKRSATA